MATVILRNDEVLRLVHSSGKVPPQVSELSIEHNVVRMVIKLGGALPRVLKFASTKVALRLHFQHFDPVKGVALFVVTLEQALLPIDKLVPLLLKFFPSTDDKGVRLERQEGELHLMVFLNKLIAQQVTGVRLAAMAMTPGEMRFDAELAEHISLRR